MSCPCAFGLRRIAQNVGDGFGSFEGVLLPARRAHFLSYGLARLNIMVGENYTSIGPKQQESMFPSNGRDWDNCDFSGLCGLCAAYVSWSCRTAAKSLEQKKEKTRRETRGETSAGTRRNQKFNVGTDFFFEQREETRRKTRSETRRETRAGTKAGTRRNQEIMMEQNPFPEQRKQRERRDKKGDKKGDKRRNPSGTRRNQEIMMDQTPFFEQKKEDKKRDKRWNQSRNQEEPGNHDGTDFF